MIPDMPKFFFTASVKPEYNTGMTQMQKVYALIAASGRLDDESQVTQPVKRKQHKPVFAEASSTCLSEHRQALPGSRPN